MWIKLHVMQAWTWAISALIIIFQAVAICKILYVETTLGMTLEREPVEKDQKT